MKELKGKIEAEVERLKALPDGAATCKVYVAFAKEEYQRKVLEKISTGHIPAYFETSNLDDKYKYGGTNVLKVEEAPEPQDVIYLNVGVKLEQSILEQTGTLSVTLAVLLAITFIIKAIAEKNRYVASQAIVFCNMGLPMMVKKLNGLERHATVGYRESSLLLKLVFARWLTAAVIIYIVRRARARALISFDTPLARSANDPVEETLDQTNLAQIGSLLWADAFTTPIIRLFDMSTFGKQLVLAPLAKTQLKMNSFFRGTQWSPAERYTDMSKTIFVVLFYGPIFPLGYWILTRSRCSSTSSSTSTASCACGSACLPIDASVTRQRAPRDARTRTEPHLTRAPPPPPPPRSTQDGPHALRIRLPRVRDHRHSLLLAVAVRQHQEDGTNRRPRRGPCVGAGEQLSEQAVVR